MIKIITTKKFNNLVKKLRDAENDVYEMNNRIQTINKINSDLGYKNLEMKDKYEKEIEKLNKKIDTLIRSNKALGAVKGHNSALKKEIEELKKQIPSDKVIYKVRKIKACQGTRQVTTTRSRVVNPSAKRILKELGDERE